MPYWRPGGRGLQGRRGKNELASKQVNSCQAAPPTRAALFLSLFKCMTGLSQTRRPPPKKAPGRATSLARCLPCALDPLGIAAPAERSILSTGAMQPGERLDSCIDRVEWPVCIKTVNGPCRSPLVDSASLISLVSSDPPPWAFFWSLSSFPYG